MSFVTPVWWTEGKQQIWDSGWFAVAATQTYTKTHGLNVQPLHIEVWFSASATGGGESPVSDFLGDADFVGQTQLRCGCYIFNVTTTQLSLTTRGSVGITTVPAWATSGYYRVLVWG